MAELDELSSKEQMTPKQHQFAREVVLGKSQADAYRSAFCCSPTTVVATLGLSTNRFVFRDSSIFPEKFVAAQIMVLNTRSRHRPRRKNHRCQ